MSETHVGKVVDGRYRLDRLLGEGTGTTSYVGTDVSAERPVAVKILRGADSERFAAEARAIATLSHPNLVPLYDFGFDDALGAHFMVSEYSEGVLLSDRMKQVMSADLMLRVSLEIASALDYAHAQGVLHRDLKPESVILAQTEAGDVAKVLDFGLAHLMDATAELAEEMEVPRFDPEHEVRTNEVGRPVPDTDDFDREDSDTGELSPPAETVVDVESPDEAVVAFGEATDAEGAGDPDDVQQTQPMSSMSPADVGLVSPPISDETDAEVIAPAVSDDEVVETTEMSALSHDTTDAASTQPDEPGEAAEQAAEEAATQPIPADDTDTQPISDAADDVIPQSEAERSAEIDLRKSLFENEPSRGKGLSVIVSAKELETSVLPGLDLSEDSALREEE